MDNDRDTDSNCSGNDGCNAEVLCDIDGRCGDHHIDSNDDNNTNDNLADDLTDDTDFDVGKDNDGALDGYNLVGNVTDVDSTIDGRDVTDGTDDGDF